MTLYLGSTSSIQDNWKHDTILVMIVASCCPSSCWLVLLGCSQLHDVLSNVRIIPSMYNCLLVFDFSTISI